MLARAYRCPICRGKLEMRGEVDCVACARSFPAARWNADIPNFIALDVGRLDRLLGFFYDHLGRLHDPASVVFFPILDGATEGQLRSRFDALVADALARKNDEPLRILDIGCGTGRELMRFAAGAPGAELYGNDLSETMLRQCVPNLARKRISAELCLADAHHLPYEDEYFDLVTQVGGINAFSDKARALSEMVRVAKPGAVIAVLDEQLDTSRPQNAFRRLGFRAVSWWDREQHAPLEFLPPNVEDVEVRQLTRFYYGMRFTKGARAVR